MIVHSGSVSHLVLLALRPGPMETTALYDRCPAAKHIIAQLIRAGLIVKWGESSYRITARGVAACPSRRSVALSRRDMRGRQQRIPSNNTAGDA